ncbi:poly(A) polymerase [Enhydrobacter sp. H5]|nr:poly(A) polymerase [Enhydrobacter sp. H5]
MAKKTRKSPSTATAVGNTPTDYVLDRQSARRDAKKLGLNKADLPNSIKEVISTLTQAGFEAYIVGGGVRDALLGLKPKDFDAVTNATPNQIKEVFGKRCRIIGRRFQLCHVYSGRDMIEVATFRAPPKDNNHLTEDGMIMRDNVWGDIYQDVVRRDFSINALYYQPFDDIVYDFCGGLKDVENRTIRLLGDTQKRVEEDPVRLLRALRFKAKLQFDFDNALNQQFNAQNWALLAQVSPHRLYDETQKMFTGGYLVPMLPLLFDYGAFSQLLFYPPTTVTPLLNQVTINTDRRIGSGKSINPAFFYATILWENYLYLLDKFKKNTPFSDAQNQAANKVLDKQRQHTAMPKFAEQFIKDIWLMQPRLAQPRKKNLQKLFENPRFRAAYDFLMMREQVEAKNQALAKQHGVPITLDDESTNGMGHWWAWFQTLGAKQQQQAIDEFDLELVRLRFANIVNQTSFEDDSVAYQTSDVLRDNEADMGSDLSHGKRRRQRRRLPFAASSQIERELVQDTALSTKAHKLTQQQQLEKAQLQQLSLATHTNSAPAKSLIVAPIIAPKNDDYPYQPSVSASASAYAEPNAHPNNSNLGRSRKRDKAYLSAASVPAKRARRTPSSNWSILEQRQQADITTSANDLLGESVSPTPVKQSIDNQAVTHTDNDTDISIGTDTVKRSAPNESMIDNGVVQPKPKRAPRTRKKAVADSKVLAEAVTKDEAPAAPKRTRKRAVKIDGHQP